MEDWLKYLVCFILGWIIARMMGEGFSVGGFANSYDKFCNYTPGTDGYTCSTGNIAKGICPLICVEDPGKKRYPDSKNGVCKFDWGQNSSTKGRGEYENIACHYSNYNSNPGTSCYLPDQTQPPYSKKPRCWRENMPLPKGPGRNQPEGPDCYDSRYPEDPTNCSMCMKTYCHDTKGNQDECMKCVLTDYPESNEIKTACIKDKGKDPRVQAGKWCNVDDICPFLDEKDCNVDDCEWYSDSQQCLKNLDPCNHFSDPNNCKDKTFKKGKVTDYCKWDSDSNKCKSDIDKCAPYSSNQSFCEAESDCIWIDNTCKSKTPTPSPTPTSECFTKLNGLDIPRKPTSECEAKVQQNITKLSPPCTRAEINEYCDNIK